MGQQAPITRLAREVPGLKTVQYWPEAQTPRLQVNGSSQPRGSSCRRRRSGGGVGGRFKQESGWEGVVVEAMCGYGGGSKTADVKVSWRRRTWRP
jgi:hypothetical protein